MDGSMNCLMRFARKQEKLKKTDTGINQLNVYQI